MDLVWIRHSSAINTNWRIGFFKYINISALSLDALDRMNEELELESTKPVNPSKKDCSIQNKWNNKEMSLGGIAER